MTNNVLLPLFDGYYLDRYRQSDTPVRTASDLQLGADADDSKVRTSNQLIYI
jgi:hypothetical protein